MTQRTKLRCTKAAKYSYRLHCQTSLACLHCTTVTGVRVGAALHCFLTLQLSLSNRFSLQSLEKERDHLYSSAHICLTSRCLIESWFMITLSVLIWTYFMTSIYWTLNRLRKFNLTQGFLMIFCLLKWNLFPCLLTLFPRCPARAAPIIIPAPPRRRTAN